MVQSRKDIVHCASLLHNQILAPAQFRVASLQQEIVLIQNQGIGNAVGVNYPLYSRNIAQPLRNILSLSQTEVQGRLT